METRRELEDLLSGIDRLLGADGDFSPSERAQLGLCRSAIAYILAARAAAATDAVAPASPAAAAGPAAAASKLPRLLIVEDDDEYRARLVEALRPAYDCRDFPSAEAALAALTLAPAADALLLDYRLPGMDGLAFLGEATRRFPLGGIPSILLTSAEDRALEGAAYEAGSVNFLRKPCSPEAVKLRLDAAVRNAQQVAERTRSFLRSRIARAIEEGGEAGSGIDEEAIARYRLSSREADVTRLLAQGLQAKEIADGLGLSPHTVVNHIRACYAKCGVSNRVELLRKVSRP